MTEFDIIFPGKKVCFLPNSINNDEELSTSFELLLGSIEASKAKSVVYFYCSENPLPCRNGSSTILYIGKTKGSIKNRYFQYAGKLSKGKNGDFYKNIINNYGGLRMGYFFTEEPRREEKMAFTRFRKTYKQYPPKSQKG